MKYLLTNREINNEHVEKEPFGLGRKSIGSFTFFSDDLEQLVQDDSLISMTEGYLRDFNLKNGDAYSHSLNVTKEMLNQWPLPENISGSFSTVLIVKDSSEVILCNDLVGLYPIYYRKVEKGIFISNSIILLAIATGDGLDEVGILQRSIGHDFSNIGSRTIVKDCKRLLPGEYLRMDFNGRIIDKKYDNTLYHEISSPKQKEVSPKEYWSAFKKEVDLCLTDQEEVNIALSGGIDSRVILGAVSQNKRINCLTFGNKENYETRIAAKLAKRKKASFKNFYAPHLYFPSYEVLKKYTLQTEAVQICSWLEITESIKTAKKIPMLLGELCEALPGRNIKKFSSRKFRQDNFLKYYLLGRDYEFETSTPELFEHWKEQVLQRYLIYYHEKSLSRMDVTISQDEIKNAVKEDLEELFSRIEAHDLPYAELYDELFSWYTYTRMRLAKQLSVANSKFEAYSPAMSLSVLRNTSNIHPNMRLNYRFAKKLFNEEKDLRNLRGIPTSQAPIVPHNFPDFLKFPIWGLRSKIDGLLIKRMMKNKNPNARYRLFKSINWAVVYQNPEMERNLRAYFKTNHLGKEFFRTMYNQCLQRKELKKWPFANIEVINAAGLNIEIDLIKELKTTE